MRIRQAPSQGAPGTFLLSLYGTISYDETPVPENEVCPPVSAVRINAPSSRPSSRLALHHAGFMCAAPVAHPLAATEEKSLGA